MNIVIAAPGHVPLVIGGAERLWWGMLEHLNRETSYSADLIKLPAPERDFWEVVDSYRRFAELDLREYDAIISTKYPAWMSDHHRQICYMQHPLRGLYDTYPPNLPELCEDRHPEVRRLTALLRGGERSRESLDECFQRIQRLREPRGPRRLRRPVPDAAFAFPGPLIREVVHFCDSVAFRPGAVQRFFAISQTVAGRDGYFPADADVVPLYHPPYLAGFRPPRPGRYLLTVSRLEHPKRIDLLIEAMQRVRANVELLIAGTGPHEARLHVLAADNPRIRFLGSVADEALLDLYAEAIAVLFVPLDEDFGLVTLEAMKAGKPVVTTRDSGGARELVSDGETGYIVDPDSVALATRIEQLVAKPELAKQMGECGLARASAVSWERVFAALLDGLAV